MKRRGTPDHGKNVNNKVRFTKKMREYDSLVHTLMVHIILVHGLFS